MSCPHCNSERIEPLDNMPIGMAKYKCNACGRVFYLEAALAHPPGYNQAPAQIVQLAIRVAEAEVREKIIPIIRSSISGMEKCPLPQLLSKLKSREGLPLGLFLAGDAEVLMQKLKIGGVEIKVSENFEGVAVGKLTRLKSRGNDRAE